MDRPHNTKLTESNSGSRGRVEWLGAHYPPLTVVRSLRFEKHGEHVIVQMTITSGNGNNKPHHSCGVINRPREEIVGRVGRILAVFVAMIAGFGVFFYAHAQTTQLWQVCRGALERTCKAPPYASWRWENARMMGDISSEATCQRYCEKSEGPGQCSITKVAERDGYIWFEVRCH
jgi:hypothetical protein